MQLLSAASAQSLMNQYGRDRRPFLFVVSYDRSQCLVQPTDQLSPSELQFDFGAMGSNYQPHALFPPAHKTLPEWTWQAQAPSFAAYQRSFAHVHSQLQRGDSFLCNLTCELPLTSSLTLSDLFCHSHARYRLWWRERCCCFSPEPFVSMAEGQIRSFPMKGTIPADHPQAEAELLNNPKEAAEHATIVDLIRNDLSIIATHVHVARYRYVEHVHTHRGDLLQTSSEIVGQLPTDWHTQLGSLLFQLLPAGSITGAPKRRTAEIIHEAETHHRGFYTGVMGLFDGERLESAVMIRFVEQRDGKLYYKAGGGITAQSQAQEEYAEVIAKAYAPLSSSPIHPA